MRNNNIQLSLHNPCAENWDKMTPQAKGRFCQACQKEVTDFTKMSNQEIVTFLQQQPTGCGRFTSNQLETVYQPTQPSNHNKLPKLLSGLALAYSILFNTPTVFSQSTAKVSTQQVQQPTTSGKQWLIKGKVHTIDEGLIAGASIAVKGTTQGTVSNQNGDFELLITQNDHTTPDNIQLECSFVGYQSQVIDIDLHHLQELNILLEVNAIELEEVAVTAYAARSERRVIGGGYSVMQIERERSLVGKIWQKIKRFPKWVSKPFRKQFRTNDYEQQSSNFHR